MCRLLLSSIAQIILMVVVLVHQTYQSPIYRRSASSQEYDYVDRSCSEDQIKRCHNASSSSCTSLKEAIVKRYNVDSGLLLSDATPHHLFSLFDLFYSGLLTDEDAPPANARADKLNTSKVYTESENRCRQLLNRIQLSTKDSSCEWRYVCQYNPNYFPSFTVKAVLEETSDEASCRSKTVSNVKFVRTSCKANPDEDQWCKCDTGLINTGYEHH